MRVETAEGRTMKDHEKERIKLTATFLNNIAIAMIVFGFVAPLIGSLYGLTSAASLDLVLKLGYGWLVAGVILHFMALYYLGDLDK
ncbi:MAG: hypothetical protein ACLP8A_11845 [Methylovirgula sp.]